jgi:hypothetical protein
MKKVNLLSRAEMKNVMGGSDCSATCPVGSSASITGCTGTCTGTNGSVTCVGAGGGVLTKQCKVIPT